MLLIFELPSLPSGSESIILESEITLVHHCATLVLHNRYRNQWSPSRGLLKMTCFVDHVGIKMDCNVITPASSRFGPPTTQSQIFNL